MIRWVLFCLTFTCAASCAFAADRPQFLGPTRNGVYAGTDLAKTWPTEGPPVVWQKKVGAGFSGPAVSGHLVVLFHRSDDKEIIDCMDARTGAVKWTFSYPTEYRDDFGFDEGPRATPCIADGNVYAFGAEGMLTCLDFLSGKKIWQLDTKAEFHQGKGFFGMACSPMVEGANLLLNLGGQGGAGIVAFDKDTGKVAWKCANDEAGYASPIAATIHDHRYAFFFTRAGLVAADPADGKVQFQFHWRSRENASVNAATPVIIDDMIFLSACYGTGAVLLKIQGNGVEKLWSGDDILSNHYMTSVRRGDFLFGIDGRCDPGFSPAPSLRCVEWKTGKIRWEEGSVGAASLILAGDRLAGPHGTGRVSLRVRDRRRFQGAGPRANHARSCSGVSCDCRRVSLRAKYRQAVLLRSYQREINENPWLLLKRARRGSAPK